MIRNRAGESDIVDEVCKRKSGGGLNKIVRREDIGTWHGMP